MTAQPSQEVLARLVALLLEHAERADLMLVPVANQHLTVQMKETQQFKKVATVGNEEFTLQSVRYGKRAEPIFVLEPAGEKIYGIAEVVLKDAPKLFPGLADFVRSAADEVGSKSETLSGGFTFLAKHAAALHAGDVEVAQAKARAEAAAENAGNELFGMF